MPADHFCSLINSLQASTRCCMDPVDYVYGVLGMLQIKIPRMTDPKKVWQRFLSELDDYMDMAGFKNEDTQDAEGSKLKVRITEYAYNIDLTTVERVSDIYGYILDFDVVK